MRYAPTTHGYWMPCHMRALVSGEWHTVEAMMWNDTTAETEARTKFLASCTAVLSW